MRTLTVAMIGPSAPFKGGIVHYTALLLAELLRSRHRVSFFRFSRPYPRWLYPGAATVENASEEAPSTAAHGHGIDWLNPFSWERVAREVRRLDPDVVIVPWWTSFWTVPYWWILRRIRSTTRAKVLFICHNVIPHEDTALDRAGARLVLGLGTECFVHSRDEADRLRALLPRMAVQVVPHPTYARFNTGRYTRDEARAQLEVFGDTLLFFGFVRPYKGLVHLLRALAEPQLARRELTLFVVGEFWDDRKEYERLVGALSLRGRVRLIDRYVTDPEMERYFAAADVAVLPYTSVTGSGAAQLAKGFRRPIVASALGDLTDVVQDGVTGYLVPPADPARLAGAVARALDEKERLQRNVESASDDRTWRAFVDRIERAVGSSGMAAAAQPDA